MQASVELTLYYRLLEVGGTQQSFVILQNWLEVPGNLSTYPHVFDQVGDLSGPSIHANKLPGYIALFGFPVSVLKNPSTVGSCGLVGNRLATAAALLSRTLPCCTV